MGWYTFVFGTQAGRCEIQPQRFGWFSQHEPSSLIYGTE
jgi:hypothetical protein